MSEKKNAVSSSSRRFALGVNLTTAVIVVVGALVAAGVYFGYTSNVLSTAAERSDELTTTEAELAEVRSETLLWRNGDPALIETLGRLRAAEAAVPIDNDPNAANAKASSAQAIAAAAASSGVVAEPFPDNVATELTVGAPTGLSSTTVFMRVSGTPAQVAAFTSAVQSQAGVTATVDAVRASVDGSGQMGAWVRLRFWFTPVTPMFPPAN